MYCLLPTILDDGTRQQRNEQR